MKAHLASRSLNGQRARASRQTARPHLRHHGDVDQPLDVSASNHVRQHPHRPRLRRAHQSGLMGRPQTHARAGHRVILEQPRAQRSQLPSVERLFLGDWRGHRPLRRRHRLRSLDVHLHPRPTRRARSRDDSHRRLRAALVHGDPPLQPRGSRAHPLRTRLTTQHRDAPGTFQLTDKARDAPPPALAAALVHSNTSASVFRILLPGESALSA